MILTLDRGRRLSIRRLSLPLQHHFLHGVARQSARRQRHHHVADEQLGNPTTPANATMAEAVTGAAAAALPTVALAD
ncbi:hypothetical protein [Sphingomonas jatrophae]|uniref:hypothetical protein n=1 Tax=Sphingomonas jatrophae TaxID=1166337 RepID=UPI000B897FE0|nr:hypothetical protein [Sphingomonas jatrophae]